MKNKIFAIFMAMLMIIAMSVVALAENDGEMENTTGDAVQNAKVTVNLKLKNNLGLAGAIFEVEYDSTLLTPVDTDFVKSGDITNLAVVASNKEEGKITFVVLSSQGQTVEGDGTLAKLSFKVSETAPVGGTTSITIKCVESAKANGAAIDSTTIAQGAATLTFVDVIPGDVNNDGRVNDKDAIHLLYHSFGLPNYSVNQNCDFNDDGRVNDKDAIYLLYYSFGLPGYSIS